GVRPRPPEPTGLARVVCGEENPCERGDEHYVSLISELRDLAQPAVLEEHETKSAPGHGDAGWRCLQFVPEHQATDRGGRPRVDVVNISLPPSVGHADEA